jgi:hypothetical protein
MATPDQDNPTPVHTFVEVELRLTATLDVYELTKDWTPRERQRLSDREEDAKEALAEAIIAAAKREGESELEVIYLKERQVGPERSSLCAKPECRHTRACHSGARVVQGVKDRDEGLATACDEYGCPCGGFREAAIEPEQSLTERNAAAIQRVGDAVEGTEVER